MPVSLWPIIWQEIKEEFSVWEIPWNAVWVSSELHRVELLQDQNELFGKIQTEFDRKWENSSFPGWLKETSSALTHAGAHLDLSAFSSWEVCFSAAVLVSSIRFSEGPLTFLCLMPWDYNSKTSFPRSRHPQVSWKVKRKKHIQARHGVALL